MSRQPEPASVQEAAEALARLLGPGAVLAREDAVVRQGRAGRWDAVVRKGRVSFGIEWKGASDALRVGAAAREIGTRSGKRGFVPVLAVPFMGETGRRLCAEAGLSWVDLCGNAWIDAPGVTVRILGRPNRRRSATRPLSVFAPRSSRVVRAMLLESQGAPGWRDG